MNLEKHRLKLIAARDEMDRTIAAIDTVIAYTSSITKLATHKKPAISSRTVQRGERRDAVYEALRAHPDGLTVAELAKATKLDPMAIHNALRPLRARLTLTETGSQGQKSYALKKGDEKTGVKKSTLTKPLKPKKKKGYAARRITPEGEARRRAGYFAYQERMRKERKAQSAAA